MERLYRWGYFYLSNGRTVQLIWLLINQWKDCTDGMAFHSPMEKLYRWDDFYLANGKTVQMRLLLINQWKNCTDEMTSN